MPSAVERSFSYCDTSAPETKALSPSPFSTITRTSESRSKRSSTFGIASHMSMEMALRRAGLLNVSQPIEPCFSAMMRSVSSPAAKAGFFWTATSVSCVMGGVPERETAIVSRSGAARQGFPVHSGLAPDSSITRGQREETAAHSSVWSDPEQIGMQEREHEVQREPGEHFSPPDFVEPEVVASADDRGEGDVGGHRCEALPVHADRPVLAPILQHRTRDREQQESAEEDQRSDVAAGDQMHRRPERDPPQDGMARDAQDAARFVHVPDRAFLAHSARVAVQRAAGDEHHRHGHQHHPPPLELVPDHQPPVSRLDVSPDHPPERRERNQSVEAEIDVFAEDRDQARTKRSARYVVGDEKDDGGERKHFHRIHANLPRGIRFRVLPTPALRSRVFRRLRAMLP